MKIMIICNISLYNLLYYFFYNIKYIKLSNDTSYGVQIIRAGMELKKEKRKRDEGTYRIRLAHYLL